MRGKTSKRISERISQESIGGIYQRISRENPRRSSGEVLGDIS